MTWRPNENLIDGELSNRIPGKVTGWMYGTYMQEFDPQQCGTVGDMTAGFPLGPWTEELAQRLKPQLEIVWQENGLTGTELEDRRRDVAARYAAKIAAGELYYPHVAYPYLEWYSENGRVVLGNTS